MRRIANKQCIRCAGKWEPGHSWALATLHVMEDEDLLYEIIDCDAEAEDPNLENMMQTL